MFTRALLVVPILSQINPVYMQLPYFLKIHLKKELQYKTAYVITIQI